MVALRSPGLGFQSPQAGPQPPVPVLRSASAVAVAVAVAAGGRLDLVEHDSDEVGLSLSEALERLAHIAAARLVGGDDEKGAVHHA